MAHNKLMGKAAPISAGGRRRFLSGLTAFALAPFIGSLGAGSSSAGSSSALAANQKPLSIVTTTAMIGDGLQNIGKSYVNVTSLIGSGIDPHSYRQTRTDIVKLGQADLIFTNGLDLEAQLDQLLDTLAKKKPVRAVGNALSGAQLLSDPNYVTRNDPHIWMSPPLWLEVLSFLARELVQFRSEYKQQILANADIYRQEIQALSGYIAEIMASIPKSRRVLVTAHDAFGYFGREFDIEVIGIQGISTQSEAGMKRIGDLVDLIVERNISAVFAETSVSSRNVEALVEGANSRGAAVKIGAALYSDSMGKAGSYEGTYIGMMDHNATRIVQALGGAAPERGWQGRLSMS